MAEKSMSGPPTPNYAYQSDITWLSGRIDKLEKKCKLLIALMVDKKMITPEVAKVIYETDLETKMDILEWFLKENKLEKKKK